LDDDTASLSSAGSSSPICFLCHPLVTDVFERPKTTQEEKHNFYYSDLEYREFRNDCLREREPRERVVKFDPKIVSEVHTYSTAVNKDILFYSDSDLQK
jgi:hypothetical protein